MRHSTVAVGVTQAIRYILFEPLFYVGVYFHVYFRFLLFFASSNDNLHPKHINKNEALITHNYKEIFN